MAMASDPITSYSETNRIVLLTDLDPLLHNPNPNDYKKLLLSFLNSLLSFPPLASSLFSFKPFFSSLSPFLSASKLHQFPSNSLSFDLPSPTLDLISRTLSSLSSLPSHPHSPEPSNLSSSLSQLLHHYPWDHNLYPSSLPIPPNLVILLSPSFHSLDSLSFLFGNVSRAFASRGIRCSWVAVDTVRNDEARETCRLFEIGVRKLGWGFCSLDSIVLGSSLLPFGLLYPRIGVSWDSVKCVSRDVRARLSLSILDVNGKPIEYNCCDLEFADFEVLGTCRDSLGSVELASLQGGGCERKERFWKLCLDASVKMEVKVVRRYDSFVNLGECFADSVLVREVFGESKERQRRSSDEFFADRVLELVANEFGCPWRQKSVPVWEMLLSFLYKEGCWALVCVSNGEGDCCLAILRPFTVFDALLSVLGDPHVTCDLGELNVAQYVRTVDAEVCKSDRKFNRNEDLLDSQAKDAVVDEGHQKKKKMDLNALQNLTWSSFCNSVYDQFETDLYDVYYAKECNKSKKLKFLKCWMKQMKKSGCWDLTLLKTPVPFAEEDSSKLNDLPQNGEQPISSFASAEINPEPEASRMQDDDKLDSRSETCEAFFSNLSDKINQGIGSEDIDLGALAERLVNSCIYRLCQKVDRETITQIHFPLKGNDACGSMVASELIKLLLREPKEIASKHKNQNPFSQASDLGPATQVTKHVVREFELQILFRMEILQSEAGSRIEDSNKQKFIKQICLLLENIQCHMEGGFFGDWNLESYAAKIIKNRYSLTLEDVVQKIYSKMDLMLFSDEVEVPNSEDSSKSLHKKVYRDEVGENDVSNEPVSAENESFQSQKDDSGRFQRIVEADRDKKLIEAKERRERARRFSSFTSWMPDLQRVWAPKQKGMKPKTDPLLKVLKRKKQHRVSYGTVCETPLTGNKQSSPWTRGSDDDNHMADGSQTSLSVSKALFKDDL